MTTPLLIVTSDFPFGELVRQSLEETGRFVVRVTSEKDTALDFVQQMGCTLAFLDTHPDPNQAAALGQELRRRNEKIRLVVISEAGWHSAIDEITPDDFLTKPFYLPDLLGMMDRFFRPSARPVEPEPVVAKGDAPVWLSDVTRAAQHLTRLTLESSSQAALITRQDQLWAYAGQLPQAAARELAEAVGRYWDRQENSDLVRFIRLNSTEAEHMLYATLLAENMVLALVFDAETPFSTIRTQANQLVHSLCRSPQEEVQPIAAPEETEPEEEPANLSALNNILSDVPPPNPEPVIRMPSIQYDPETIPMPVSKLGPAPDDGDMDMPFDPETPSGQYAGSLPPSSLEQTVESLVITRKSKARRPEADNLEETRPRPIAEMARKLVLEPTSASLYNLDYACLLLPRFPQHYLTGDLSDRISEWMPHICVAFGWRLEYISVRPEYLQWIVNVSPSTSPAYVMRILRQHTSDKLFSEFPRFKKENPSGDFWAPGYLIMGGSQPPPAQLIRDYINQTRQRQGISQPLR
jgi:REP element-mobilizing transposase RayT/DNA-binding response OmpR family regulator